jgi:hypothetical protein
LSDPLIETDADGRLAAREQQERSAWIRALGAAVSERETKEHVEQKKKKKKKERKKGRESNEEERERNRDTANSERVKESRFTETLRVRCLALT